MKIQELLQETPLPDDWDKSKYKSHNSFASRIRYAVERAQKIGTGSSRVAFEIEYEGRPTILKIAKNKKGIAQNDYESQMLNDYYATGLGILIPMIDHDEENEYPTWLHLEKAEKMKPNQFKQFFNGLRPEEMLNVARYGSGKIQVPPETAEKYSQHIEDNEYIDGVVDLIGNYDIGENDLSRLANWGVYKNEPVIIDIGGSSEVMKLHYGD